MALTKVSGGILDPGISVAGIVTATGFDGPFTGGSSRNITAGIITATGFDLNGNGDISGNLVIGGNLTANGDFTTLNTTLREVELLRVDANSSAVAGIITQRGSGDIFSAYDTSTQVFKIADGGDITFFGGSNSKNASWDYSTNTLSFDGNGSVNNQYAKTQFGSTSQGMKLYNNLNNFISVPPIVALFVESADFQIYGSGSRGGTTYDGTIFIAREGVVELGHEVGGGGATGMKLKTVGYGVTILGTTETQKLNVTGISTFEGNIDANGALDVNGTSTLNFIESIGTSGHGAKLGGLSVGYDSLYATIQPITGDVLHLNYNAGTEVRIGAANTKVDLQVNGDVYPKASGNRDLGLTGKRWRYLYTDAAVITGIATATSFTASASGVSGQYKANEIKFDRNSYNYISCTDNSGQLVIRMGSSQVTAFAVDTSADTIFSNNRKIKMGSGNKLELYSDGSNSLITDSSSAMFVRSNRVLFQNSAGNKGYGEFTNNGSVYFTHDNTKRIETTGIGVSVYGEIAATQDYPNIRPVLDFNFAATKKLKPEMTFTRQGEASFHDGVGSVKFVSDNEPRFEHDIVTGECKGLMFEQAGTNYSWYSRRFDVIATASWIKVGSASITANTYTAPDGTSSGAFMADTISGATGTTFNGNVLRQQNTAGAAVKHTFSIYIKLITSTQATIYVRDGATGSTASTNAIPNTRNWQRVVVTSNNALTNGTVHSYYVGNTNGDIAVWGAQIERSDYVTSYIKTDGGVNGTRTADNGGVRLDGEDVTDVFNQGEGTLIAEAIPTNSITNQGLVGFYQDFGSVNRIEVRTQGSSGSTANARFESVVGSSSVVTNTSSPHAGINNVSKYAFAFQENNYASTVNGGTVQNDTNGAFPHGTGINSMIIGDSVYSQDTSVIIKRIMYYADRLPDSQLVTLTS